MTEGPITDETDKKRDHEIGDTNTVKGNTRNPGNEWNLYRVVLVRVSTLVVSRATEGFRLL